MTESVQIGIFPGLLEPAIKTAEQLIVDQSLERLEIDGMPGFWVSRPQIDLTNRTLHTFDYKEEQFIIFQ